MTDAAIHLENLTISYGDTAVVPTRNFFYGLRPGDEIKVQLVRVNLTDRQLDFAIEGLEPRARTPRRTRHR